MKLFDYPWSFWNGNPANLQRNYQSAFGSMPDLKGRYALGLDYGGQPVYECKSHLLLGGVGVSGDGVDEDDTVAKGAVTGAGFCVSP